MTISRRFRVLSATVALSLLLALAATAVAVTPGAGAAARAAAKHKPKPKPIPASKAFGFPSTSACVRGRTLTIQLHKLAGVKWVSVTVKVNGKRFKTLKRAQIGRTVKLTALPSGKLVVAVTAEASDRRTVSASRTYHTCSTQPATPPAPGSYSGGTSQAGNTLVFYVSPDGHQVQDVQLDYASLPCTPGGQIQDRSFGIASATISATGAFSATSTQTGVQSNSQATITFTMSVQFHGTSVAGSIREDVSYNNGSQVSCTTNNQSWTATRDTQGSQTQAPPPPGSYSGGTSQAGNTLSFFVAPGGGQLQDVALAYASLPCTPGGAIQDRSFGLASMPIAADGSFTATATQATIESNVPAQIALTFRGHFHGSNANGVQRVAGQLREDITYNNGTQVSCTTAAQTWSALRDTQGSQTAGPPPARSYRGGTTQAGNTLSFSVSTGGAQLQSVKIDYTSLACTPGGSLTDSTFFISTIPIAADGSFTATTTQTGIENGHSAQITFTFVGHFHGANANGLERGAGQMREDVTYSNGGTVSCTTGPQGWSATG